MNSNFRDLIQVNSLIITSGCIIKAIEHNLAEQKRQNRLAKRIRANRIIDRTAEFAVEDHDELKGVVEEADRQGLGMAAAESQHQQWCVELRDGIVNRLPFLARNTICGTGVPTPSAEKKTRIPDICVYRKGVRLRKKNDYHHGILLTIEIVHSNRGATYSKQSIEEVAADNQCLIESFVFNYTEWDKRRWQRYDPATKTWAYSSDSTLLGFNLNLLTYEQPMDEDELEDALDQFMLKADEMAEMRKKREEEMGGEAIEYQRKKKNLCTSKKKQLSLR